MSLYVVQGQDYVVTNKESLNVCDTLPAGNYVIKLNSQTDKLYLTRVQDFTSPSKIYGKTTATVSRILDTYKSRPNSTGVLLGGEKGSGKSLMAKEVSLAGALIGIPTIIVTEAWCGEQFNTFLQSIEQDCIVLFDELEKVYDDKHQQHLLSLFDGVFPTRKLFMVTVNNIYAVSSYMMNRPGRIFYLLEFTGLTIEEIREYVGANLLDKEHARSIEIVSSMFKEFNFDMLKAIVEEMNRYDESAFSVLPYLNCKPKNESKCEYTAVVESSEEDLTGYTQSTGSVFKNPYDATDFFITFYDNDEESLHITANINDIVEIDVDNGRIVYVRGKNRIVLTKVVPATTGLDSVYNMLRVPITA